MPITAVTVTSLSPAQHNSCNNVDEETTIQTYPGLGHQLSSAIGYLLGLLFLQKPRPTQEYVLADLCGWLEISFQTIVLFMFKKETYVAFG
jgi:hypothetical protein